MLRNGLALLFYLALTVVFTAPLSLHPADRAANDGDPLHISWILAWGAHQLSNDPLQLYDSNTFHPYESSLAFSEHLLVQALMVAPLHFLTSNPLLAQNVAMLLAIALSGWAMFLFLREIFHSDYGALVGGVLFAFHSYTLHEVPRLQVLSLQWWPLTALYLYRALESGRTRHYVLFGLFYLLQCLSCTYYLLYVSLTLPLWVLVLWWTLERSRPRSLAKIVASGAVVAGLVSLFSLPYLQLFRRFSYQRELADGLDLLDYVRPPDGTVWSRVVELDIREGITPHFIGYVALALAVWGLLAALKRWGSEAPARKAVLFLSLATGALGVLLSLGPTVYVGDRVVGAGVYGFLYDHVFLFRGLRSPERISVLGNFAVAVFGGYGAGLLLERLASAKARSVAVVLLLAILPLEHFAGGHFGVRVPTATRTPDVYDWLGEGSNEGPVVELPLYPLTLHRLYAVYMFYSSFHFRPIVFGRTSFYPPATDYLAWQLREFPDEDSLALLRRIGVTTLVVHPELWSEEERAARLETLRGMDGLHLVKEFPPLAGSDYERLGLGDERVYRLTEPTPVGSARLCTPLDEIAPDGWNIRGSGQVPAELAIDRDPSTKWRTDGQLPHDFLLLDLGRVERVAALRLTFTYPYGEFPRYVVLRGRRLDEPFETLAYRDDLAVKLETLETLLERPDEAGMTFRFEPREIRRLRIRVGGRKYDFALPDWALPELHLYRACE